MPTPFTGNTSYLPDNTQLITSSGPSVDPYTIDPRWLMRMKMNRQSEQDRQDAIDRNLQRKLTRTQLEAMKEDRLTAKHDAAYRRDQEKEGQRYGRQQQEVARRGQPVFTKTVGGPGMIPGTIRLNQWEPGAAFAGYSGDLGSGPASASIQAPGMSRASLQPSAPQEQGITDGDYGTGREYAEDAFMGAKARSDRDIIDRQAMELEAERQRRAMLGPRTPGGGARPSSPWGGVSSGSSTTAPYGSYGKY